MTRSRLVAAAAALALGALLSGAGVTHAGTNVTLYDIDFGSPPHTVGLPPVIGGGPAPRNTVSGIPFGSPTVVASFGPLLDQPLEFDSFDGQGDQIRLTLNDFPPSYTYTLQCELTALTLESQADFAILFDTPTVRTIRFSSTGSINIFVPGVFSGSVGTYTLGTVVLLQVDIDLAADTWNITVNNVPVHSGSFGGATQVMTIRFSTPVTPSPPGATAGLDNVVVSATLPVSVEGTTWGRIKGLYR